MPRSRLVSTSRFIFNRDVVLRRVNAFAIEFY